jgi:hypothetical protein
VHPGLWHPVVSGWFQDEYTHLGEQWLEHGERYRRSAEFLQVLRKVWTEENVDFRGANRPAVEGFRSAVQQAGNSTLDKVGMWADSTIEDLVQCNDGFRTGLIGTPEQIGYFGSRLLPLVREIEGAEADSVGDPALASA